MTAYSDSAFWHGFADMSAVADAKFVIASGEGAYVTDETGRRYYDSTSALWFANVGHGRSELADAAAEQMRRIAAFSNFTDYATASTLEFAERIAAISPLQDTKVFFTSGGSDSVDTAVKLSRRYWNLMGQPSKRIVITRERSYHGMHIGGTSLAGIPLNKDGYGTFLPEIRNVAWDDAEDLARVIDEVGAENVATFFCEPVIGAGGVYIAPDGYLQRVREICDERSVHFVADEVICGFGRTGRMFASQRWGVEPDMIVVAKGMTSGYLPMGGLLVAGHVAEPFWTTPGLVWRHGYTYSGHAAAAAVGIANLDILEREQLVERVASMELALTAALVPLRGHSYVHAVRSGAGFLGAVQLDPELIKADPTVGGRLVKEIRSRGVLSRLLADGGLQVSPPFVSTREDFALLAGAIDESLSALGSARTALPAMETELLPELTGDDAGGFGSLEARLLADVPPHHGS